MVVTYYHHNNNGYTWKLTSEDWDKLANAGWRVDSREFIDGYYVDAMKATKSFPSLRAGIEEWERVTGMDSTDETWHRFEVE